MTARVGETTFGDYTPVRPFPPSAPSSRIPNVVIGGACRSGFKPNWYMTGSDTGNDPQRLVRVKILGFPAHSSAAHSSLLLEHVRI